MKRADFPIGTRVRVKTTVDPYAKRLVGLVGTVIGYWHHYIDVEIDGHEASAYDKGWLLLPDEVESVTDEKGGAP